jgi:hypothetical protein
MSENPPTPNEIRAKIKELRAEAERLFKEEKIDEASILMEYAARLEETESHRHSYDDET